MEPIVAEAKRLNLPRFRKALEQHARLFKSGKSDATYWRYSIGIIPANVRRLMDTPELLEALAADARALRNSDPSE